MEAKVANKPIPGIHREVMPFESNYVLAPNAWLRDANLSLKAKGLLVYFLTHNDGYVITFQQILRENQDGRAAIRSSVDELVEHGYLRTERTTDERGYNGGLAYFLTNPKSENPTLENPTLENRTAYKKNTSIKEENLDRESIAQNDFERMFNQFYQLYPRKTGKGQAIKAFRKALKSESFDTVLAGVIRLANDPHKPAKQFIPYPATWLNGWGWLNEPYPEREMSREERQVWEAAQADRNRESRLGATQQVLDEVREAERRAAENPAESCPHRAVKLLCKICG